MIFSCGDRDNVGKLSDVALTEAVVADSGSRAVAFQRNSMKFSGTYINYILKSKNIALAVCIVSLRGNRSVFFYTYRVIAGRAYRRDIRPCKNLVCCLDLSVAVYRDNIRFNVKKV